MTTSITLSKLKTLSGQDVLKLVKDNGAVSVEVGGVHLFDIIKPLNALDEKFLAISSYVGEEVASEFKRKIETMRVEDMFDHRNVTDVLDSVAEGIETQTQEEAPVVKSVRVSKAKIAKKPVKPGAATKRGKPKKEVKQVATDAVTPPKRGRGRPASPKKTDHVPVEVAELDAQPFPDVVVDIVTPDPALDGHLAHLDAELDTSPYPDHHVEDVPTTYPDDDLETEPFAVSEVDDDSEDTTYPNHHVEEVPATYPDDELETEPFPDSDDADFEERDYAPDNALFEGLRDSELTAEEIAGEDSNEEDVWLGDEEGEEEEEGFSDGPIIRNIVKKGA